MKKTISILAIVALIQLALTAMVWMKNDGKLEAGNATFLLSFERSNITTITINDGETETQLQRKDGIWVTENDYPADQHKVTQMPSSP